MENLDHRDQEKIAGRRILAVTEEELQRIILDIHDGPVQDLFAALSQVNLLQQQIAHSHDPECDARSSRLAGIAALLEESLNEIRTFLGAFRPPEFAKRDLLSVLRGLIIQNESMTGNTVEFQVTEPVPQVSLPVKIALYRILQEALSNGYRHAGVKEQRVRVWTEGADLCLEVSDRGVGFNPPPLVGPTATERVEHIGLRGMRDRVALVSGTFDLWSQPGEGTRITVKVPYHDG
ncbi:MAG: sensor histidine kinase [Chloroflexi bacterium]|nr:sensor histidine kinase [Chloroflexota bacterium]